MPNDATGANEAYRFRKGHKKPQELESELQAIKERAEANGTFMLAPNGAPTKLSERQWLQVRTKAFKKWFGDWEKRANLESLKQRINGRKQQQPVEYSDEFRRVQEGSRALSEREVSEYHSSKRDITGEAGFGVLQLGLRRQLHAQANSVLNARRLLVDKKGNRFNIIEDINGQLFHDVFEIVRNYLENGELVDLHDNYDNSVCYITEDGLSGFAVEESGNLISVFNLNPNISFLSSIKDYVTECGATHLDGYNSKNQPLAEIYEKTLGWQVASMMDYNMEYDHDNIAENHGSPQVAFMVNASEGIQERTFDKDSYDEAEAYQLEQRDALLDNVSKVVDENGEPMVVDDLFLKLSKNPIPKIMRVIKRAQSLADKARELEKKYGDAWGNDYGTLSEWFYGHPEQRDFASTISEYEEEGRHDILMAFRRICRDSA